ncbi:PspC domain-containing protein [Patescibacteria group bacterium]|nr:PspC domain-containing protein [Patescibacteria group bacterium]
MKKVINTTIGQIVFNVEDDAYEKLSKYLNSIKKHFAKDKDCEEILEDIEVSIAEKFLKKRKNANLAVSLEDVESVILEMGTIKDFDKEDEEDEEEKEKGDEKKLYRNPDDVIIAGVASGLAAYFGIETALVRLIFFITIFFGGAGVAIYIVLWLILPVAKTSAEKFEMRGETVTLQHIEKAVKEGVDQLKKKDYSGLNGFFRTLAGLMLIILRLIVVVVGGAFAVAGIAGICVISFALAWTIAGVGFTDSNILLSDFVMLDGVLYWIFVAALYLVVFIPVVLVLLLGLSIIKMKSEVTAFNLLNLIVIWFISLGFAGSIVFQNSVLIGENVLEIRDEIIALHKCDGWVIGGQCFSVGDWK